MVKLSCFTDWSMSGGVTYRGPNSGSSSSLMSWYCWSESISSIQLPVPFVLSLSARTRIRADTVSWTMAAAPTTVGTPIASTFPGQAVPVVPNA